MAAVEFPIDEVLIEQLRQSFHAGPMVDDDGKRFLIEEEVDRFDGLVISIFADEHPPPHFRVRHQRESASFSIVDGTRLPGNNGLDKFNRNIQKWWKENRQYLIEKWNATRPTNCSVGPVRL